jgi:acylphosphatase
MSDDQHMAVRLVIRGKVQGVWFRNWTVGEAKALGLDGWVRNRADGSVEALISGPGDKLRTMIARCYKGPPLAQVDGIEEHFASFPPTGSGFEQRPSA